MPATGRLPARAHGRCVRELAAPRHQLVVVDHGVQQRVAEPIVRPSGPDPAWGTGRPRPGAARLPARLPRRPAATFHRSSRPARPQSAGTRRVSAGKLVEAPQGDSPCRVGGGWPLFGRSRSRPNARIRAPARRPSFTRLRTISSTKSGLPPARMLGGSRGRVKAGCCRAPSRPSTNRFVSSGGKRSKADRDRFAVRDRRHATIGPVRQQDHQATAEQDGRRGSAGRSAEAASAQWEIINDDQQQPLAKLQH